jgi:hypothetical protein
MIRTHQDRIPQERMEQDALELAQDCPTMAPPTFQLKVAPIPRDDDETPDEDSTFAGAAVPAKKNNRLTGNADLDAAFKNKNVLELGDKGIGVSILQQALLDAGYSLLGTVTGEFDSDTESIVKQFQRNEGLKPDGKVGPKTLKALSDLHNTLAPEREMAATEPSANTLSDVRTLNADEKAAAKEAVHLKAITSSGVAKAYVEVIGGKSFKERLRERADEVIAQFYAEYLVMETKRKDASKNLHDWSDIQTLAKHSKVEVDAVFGSYYDGASKAPMTKGTNLQDKWDWETDLQKDPRYKDNAIYAKSVSIVSNYADDICDKHGADFGRGPENKVFNDVVADLVKTYPKELAATSVSSLGSNGEGGVKIQAFKGDSDAANRDYMWYYFSVLMHEYLHTLQHPNYKAYREGLASSNAVLNEGMTDYFTEIIWKNLSFDDKMREEVEGPYHDPKVKHPIQFDRSIYAQIGNAERLVGIVGLKNAMAAFFQGEVQAIGG